MRFNSMTKSLTKLTTAPTGQTVFDFGMKIKRPQNFTLLFGATLLGLVHYSNHLVMNIRKETFQRNHALIEQKYGEMHREAFGSDAKINKLGYPDMGNNIYGDLLPYKDWVRMNNAQR